MGLISRAFVRTQFKLGIYQTRQITRIERGGLVISSADSRYQPNGGIRHELSPDEWLLFSWRFFPMGYREEFYDEEYLSCERYYDYFEKTGRSGTDLYSIFKNGRNTGYIIKEYFGGNRGKLYSGMHINQFGTSDYNTVFNTGSVKPIEYARSPIEAAICMLADLDDFRKVQINLDSLHKDCGENPGSCALHLKLKKLLRNCKHTDLYLEKQVAP